MVILLMLFAGMMSMVLVIRGFKEEIRLHYYREVKCQQSYTSGILY